MRQRTRTINALREHLAEYGVVAPTGIAPVGRLAAIVDGEEGTLPAPVVELARVLLGQVATLSAQVDALEKQLRQRAASDAAVRPLMTIPGIGVIAATALTTFAPPPETFAKGRDFTAWVGLTPRQHSSGGKERLGKTSKMRRRDIRRLLIIGAVATVRWAARKGAPERCRSLTQPPPPPPESTLAIARPATPLPGTRSSDGSVHRSGYQTLVPFRFRAQAYCQYLRRAHSLAAARRRTVSRGITLTSLPWPDRLKRSRLRQTWRL